MLVQTSTKILNFLVSLGKLFNFSKPPMPKNAQTTAQLHASHTPVVMLKFSKTGFSNTWTVNFQMSKLILEKAEEPEI